MGDPLNWVSYQYLSPTTTHPNTILPYPLQHLQISLSSSQCSNIQVGEWIYKCLCGYTYMHTIIIKCVYGSAYAHSMHVHISLIWRIDKVIVTLDLYQNCSTRLNYKILVIDPYSPPNNWTDIYLPNWDSYQYLPISPTAHHWATYVAQVVRVVNGYIDAYVSLHRHTIIALFSPCSSNSLRVDLRDVPSSSLPSYSLLSSLLSISKIILNKCGSIKAYFSGRIPWIYPYYLPLLPIHLYCGDKDITGEELR